MGMKKVLGLLIMLLLVVPAFAQQEPPSADAIVAKMKDKLGLTQDQISAVTPIIEKYSSQREELHQSIEDGTADRDTVRQQMKELREAETQELSQVLSAQQMTQWKQMQPKRHPGGWAKPQGEGGGSAGNGSGSDNGNGNSNSSSESGQ